MSRRKGSLTTGFDFLPLIKEERELTKSGDTKGINQNYYDLNDIDNEKLLEKVASRKRFKEMIKIINKIKKVSSDKQDELRHIYIIEAYNRQDLVVSASYICLELIENGFIEADKLIVVPEYLITGLGDNYTWLLNGNQKKGLNYAQYNNEDDEEEYSDAWDESSDAIISFYFDKNSLPTPEQINQIEQYPIFLLIDKSIDESNGSYGMDQMFGKSIMPRARDIIFEHISQGAMQVKIDAIETKEVIGLFKKYLKEKGYIFSKGLKLEGFVEKVLSKRKISSELDIKFIADAIITKQLTNSGSTNIVTSKALADFFNVEEEKKQDNENPYEELEKIRGLELVKNQINEMILRLKFDKYRKENNLPVAQIGFNAVFLGSPGTAKSTIARIIAKVLKYEKFIESDSFKEVKKSDIVGRYVGWTAAQIDEMFTQLSYKGGVIFFDEIYTLSEDDSTAFDKEAITAIVQNMENYRNIFCIFAGYNEKMKQFLSKNPGLRSRISFTFKFEDYSLEQLVEIFEGLAKHNLYILPEGYKTELLRYFEQLKHIRKNSFGNGREARTLFEISTVKMAARLSTSNRFSKNELMEIKSIDIENAVKAILESESSQDLANNQYRKIGFSL